MFDEDGEGKRKEMPEAELDITAMIDVTFLLLIFFMVTSTMQATADRQIPKSLNGDKRSTDGMIEILVNPPLTKGGTAEFIVDGNPATLDEIREVVSLRQASIIDDSGVEVMIMADGRVPSGLNGELEQMLGEFENVNMLYGVVDRREN